jgi:hypothetical protein
MTQAHIHVVLNTAVVKSRQHKPLPPVSNEERTAGDCDRCGEWDGDLQAGLGSCCRREFRPHAFPLNIEPAAILTETDIADLAEVGPPKGEALPMLPARNWLACNEQLAVQLGRAQAALRQLDDQRALVTSVGVHPDLILFDLLRAPMPDTLQGLVMTGQFPTRQHVGYLAGTNAGVMLRWMDAGVGS